MDNNTFDINNPRYTVLDFLSRVSEDDIEAVMSTKWKGVVCSSETIDKAKRAIPAIAKGAITATGHEMKDILGNFLARVDIATLERIAGRKGDLSEAEREKMRDEVFFYYTQVKEVIGL